MLSPYTALPMIADVRERLHHVRPLLALRRSYDRAALR
ncbi:hypothetical protein FRACA_1770002 [Frankia canadensis]|uniref:Uncharacterized protein n=1 Tax=Frankia canadensis TaxID=1836972 RepID=A0A2I2KNG0_9ACTN|nr:hypothetical protein FRACA_1770002 [Frankia canadensis]SOU54490.1 hypothetical protein FRACA_1770002 [Frankia canadensis]